MIPENVVNYHGIVDLAVKPTPLTQYRFLSPSGPVPIYGYYLDLDGVQATVSFVVTVPMADGTNAPVAFPSVPANAKGVVFKVASVIYYSLSGATTVVADFKTNYARYPVVGPSTNLNGGRS